MRYPHAPEETAAYVGIKATTLKEWARKGYPIESCGHTERIKLDGAQKIGRKWKFDKYKIQEFIKAGNTCESGNENTNLKTVQLRPPRIGLTNTISKTSAIKEQLMAAVSAQKSMQKARPGI